MWEDPIVKEIHAIRARIFEECGFDMKKIIARLQAKESDHQDRIIHKEASELPDVESLKNN